MIPATALGGALIEGWCGPILWRLNDGPYRRGVWGPIGASSEPERSGVVKAGDMRPDPDVFLDPTRPEVQHRVSDVLRSLGHEVGHLLPVALGGRVGDAVEVGPSCGADAPGGPCDYEPGHAQPHKTGNTRMLRPVPAARVSARVLADSVEGVEQGRGVVRGVLGEWRMHGNTWVRTTQCGALAWPSCNAGGWDLADYTPGGHRLPSLASGPETGPAGRAAADAAALRLGWALLSADAPDGVRVPGEVDRG